MSKPQDRKGVPSPPVEVLHLWEPRKEIRDTTEEIERLTKAVFPMNGETNYLVETTEENDPFRFFTTDLVSMSQITSHQHLYKTRDSRRWGILDHMEHLKIHGVSWMCRVDPPDWARDIPVDVLVYLANLLPIDKIFILAGLCKRFRAICFGTSPNGIRGRLERGRIIWNNYLTCLSYHPVPPNYPRSRNPFIKANVLALTHLSKWGFPMEKTMRHRRQAPATWIPLTLPDFKPCKTTDGAFYYPELKDDPTLGQRIRVMIGDDAICIGMEATSSITSDVVARSVRASQKFSAATTFCFFVDCPPPGVLETFTNRQFEQIGLGLPSRDPKTQLITSLPLRDTFIPWLPETPLTLYRATIGWRIRVKVYERRSFKDHDNETSRQLIIQRFKSGKFCKYCYKQIVEKDSAKSLPSEWMEMVPTIGPICIDCFTHMFSGELTVVKGNNEAIFCPKCTRILMPAYRNQRGYVQGNGTFDTHYHCTACNGPKLHVMFIKQQLRFQPHTTNWTRQCSGLDPLDTELMKKSKNIKQERYITTLKLSIESGIANIVSQQAILEDMGVHDYTKIQVQSRDAEIPVARQEQLLKRPATTSAGKAPPPLKKPMMSPASLRLSGKKPMSLTKYDGEGDEEEDDEEEEGEMEFDHEEEFDGYSW